MATDNIKVSLRQRSNTPSSSFKKDTTFTSNSGIRCSFRMAADKEILVIPVAALRTGLKFIAVQSDAALTASAFRGSSATGTSIGSDTVIDTGAFAAGQSKQSDGVDFSLPGSGSNINNFRITKDASTGEATIFLEMYFSETIVEADV
jgi:hypothetical protein|tara:strand:+ start:117 stop:560 length:444 start_codon:yes stop_codon:yes gene_type:complete